MFKADGLLFRSVNSLADYLKRNPNKQIVVTYVTEYMLGDPMEQ